MAALYEFTSRTTFDVMVMNVVPFWSVPTIVSSVELSSVCSPKRKGQFSTPLV